MIDRERVITLAFTRDLRGKFYMLVYLSIIDYRYIYLLNFFRQMKDILRDE